jgi:hypothetical protein
MNSNDIYNQPRTEGLSDWVKNATCLNIVYYDDYNVMSEMDEYVKIYQKGSEYKVIFDSERTEKVSEYATEWSLSTINYLISKNTFSPTTKHILLKAQELLQISEEKLTLDQKIKANRESPNSPQSTLKI